MVFARAYLFGPESNPEEEKRRLSATNPGFMVQAVRAAPHTNEFFLEMLAAQTFQAESSGNLLAKKPEIDFLLRLAGTTQIADAIRVAGARGGEPFVVVAAGGSEVNGGRLGRHELRRRELSKTDLRRVEKAALLNTRRS